MWPSKYHQPVESPWQYCKPLLNYKLPLELSKRETKESSREFRKVSNLRSGVLNKTQHKTEQNSKNFWRGRGGRGRKSRPWRRCFWEAVEAGGLVTATAPTGAVTLTQPWLSLTKDLGKSFTFSNRTAAFFLQQACVFSTFFAKLNAK